MISLVFRRERSLHGVDPRALKSALQKYARRGDREKGLWCLVEMDRFALPPDELAEVARRDGLSVESARRRVDALRTNLMNRLVVMVTEEVNVHAVWLPAAAQALYRAWCDARGLPEGRRHLVALYLLILEAEKCRLVSDYRTVFNLAPHYLPAPHHDALVATHRAMLRAHAPALYALQYEQFVDGMSATTLAARALEHALAGRDEALFWCGRLVEHRHAAQGTAALWDGLLAAGFARPSIEALRFFSAQMTHRERPIYLYHALLLVTLRDRLDDARPSTLAPRVEVDVDALYAAHAERPAPTLDAFVFDLHTGARSDEGRTIFALEGAHVENECTRFLVPAYRALYVDFKRRLDAWSRGAQAVSPDARAKPPVAPSRVAPSVSSSRVAAHGVEALASRLGVPLRVIDEARERDIAALPRAQKRTAPAKKAVFVTASEVIKGPYAGEEGRLRLNLVHTALAACVARWLGLAAATVAPWRALLRAPGGYYLVGENLGRGDGGDAWAVVSTKVETDVKVLPRGSFVRRVSELEAEPLGVDPRVWSATLQHLYVIYLLGIGDEGSHNVVLAADGRVVGIDLEEFRSATRTPDEPLGALFKRVSAAHRTIYTKHLAAIRRLDGGLDDAQRAEALALGADPARVDAIAPRAAAFAQLLR